MAEIIFVEDILDRVEERLNLIRLANGYGTPIDGIVKRATIQPPKGEDLPGVNFWSDGFDSAKDEYGRLAHLVRLYVEVREHTRDEPFVNVAGRLAKDVHFSLHRTVARPAVSDPYDIDLGGTVGDLNLAAVDYYIGEGGTPFCAVLLSYIVTTYTTMFDLTVHGPNVGLA